LPTKSILKTIELPIKTIYELLLIKYCTANKIPSLIARSERDPNNLA
jgi:hypothetical protein